MPKSLTTCNETSIEAYLNGSSDDNSVTALMEHLQSCLQCRERMESSAADRATWSDAVEFLRTDDGYAYEFQSASPPAISWVSEFDLAASVQRTESSAEISQVLSQLDPTDDPHMLGRLGGYEVSGVVGSGGMGIVLKAFDRPLDRIVAIKVLAPRLASSGAARLRFAREAKAAATVLHPNVIVIHGVSNDGAMPFLVMPYLRGESLQRQGLIHRDIKPANIMLEDGVERVTLTDFGLARAVDDASMTRSGVVAGTPQYMSPEQARGDNLDARSDLFSLGSVMYAMCTGRPPFRADSSYGTLRRITDTEPRPIREVNPSIPEWLDWFVQRLHAKNIEERIQTAAQVSTVLQKCIAHVQQPMALDLPDECRMPVRRWELWPISRKPARTLAMITLSCMAIAGVYYIGKSLVTNPVPTASQATPPSPKVASDKAFSTISEWDSIQLDIEAFEREVDSSEADGQRLWTRKLEVKSR
jgi:eukaryotic-like serine/threonine-protein kinase